MLTLAAALLGFGPFYTDPTPAPLDPQVAATVGAFFTAREPVEVAQVEDNDNAVVARKHHSVTRQQEQPAPEPASAPAPATVPGGHNCPCVEALGQCQCMYGTAPAPSKVAPSPQVSNQEAREAAAPGTIYRNLYEYRVGPQAAAPVAVPLRAVQIPAQAYYTYPSAQAGGCANGQCGVGYATQYTVQPRRGLFGGLFRGRR
jgi:hypothetical protein